ncbi:MAG: hypothetical protein PHT33_11480 [bacterium]|nr:hypothetical protein [bacterium]
MKKFLSLVTVLLLLGIAGTAIAADNGKPVPGPGHSGRNMQPMQGMQRSFDKLNLTEKQKIRIRQIRKDFTAKAEQIRKSKLSDKQRREKLHNLTREMRAKINNVLTPKQRELRAAAMKNMRERMRHNDRSAGATAIRSRKELGLSDKQVKQIEKINKDSRTRTETLRKANSANRVVAGSRIRIIRRENDQRVMKVLTGEQQRKLERIMKEAGPNRENNGHARNNGPRPRGR